MHGISLGYELNEKESSFCSKEIIDKILTLYVFLLFVYHFHSFIFDPKLCNKFQFIFFHNSYYFRSPFTIGDVEEFSIRANFQLGDPKYFGIYNIFIILISLILF